MLTISPNLAIPRDELRFTFARSSGPGGQNVNKVASKATLRWSVVHSPSLPEDVRQRFVARYGGRLTKDGELLISGQRFRDQGKNVADCLARLQEMLAAVATPPRRRRATRPTRGSLKRRRKDKMARSAKKQSRRGVAE